MWAEKSLCSSWILKRQRKQRSNCQHPFCHRKSKRNPEKHLFLLHCLHKNLCVKDKLWNNKLWKILKETGMPDHLTCLLQNLYAGQETIVRTGHVTTDWFQIGKGVHLGCIPSPCLFNLYAEYICEIPGWMKHKLESRLLTEIPIISHMQMTPPLRQKAKRNWRASWWRWRGEWKSWLKIQHSKN